MSNNEKIKIFDKILEKKITSLLRNRYRTFEDNSLLASMWESLMGLFKRSREDIATEIQCFSKQLARESFKEFMNIMDNLEQQELAARPKDEWLIMGFSSTDNLFANSKQISIDEKTIRGAVVFWTGNDSQFRSIKNIIDDKQIDANTNELFGAFTLYAVKIHSHGELYRGAKEDDRYMISVKIISCCKDDDIDLTAVHLGHISPDVAQECEFFSLT